MKEQGRNLDTNVLRTLYENEMVELQRELLSGASWEDVRERRHRILLLSREMYKRPNTINNPNPAEINLRNDPVK